MKQARLLVLRTTGSFVARADEECLRGAFDMRTFDVVLSPPRSLAWNMVKLACWLLWHLPRARGVFFRFADYHAFLPAVLCRLFRRRLWIVLAGYDAHHFSEYNYGVYDSRLRAALVRYAVRSAHALLPVHDSLHDGTNSYAFDPPRATGVKSLVPGIRGEVHVLHNGFDSEYWCPAAIARERLVVTVASVPHGSSDEALRRMAALKGVPLIVDLARRMPDVSFVLVGPTEAMVRAGYGDLPENLTVTGLLPADDVREWYRRAHVYAHPSLTEGMPNAVAEAMLCGCIPVGSDVNGTATLIGDAGIVIERADVELWAQAVARALDKDSGDAARSRIREEFTVERRCTGLREIVAGP